MVRNEAYINSKHQKGSVTLKYSTVPTITMSKLTIKTRKMLDLKARHSVHKLPVSRLD